MPIGNWGFSASTEGSGRAERGSLPARCMVPWIERFSLGLSYINIRLRLGPKVRYNLYAETRNGLAVKREPAEVCSNPALPAVFSAPALGDCRSECGQVEDAPAARSCLGPAKADEG